MRDVVGLGEDATLLARLARRGYRDLPHRERGDRGASGCGELKPKGERAKGGGNTKHVGQIRTHL